MRACLLSAGAVPVLLATCLYGVAASDDQPPQKFDTREWETRVERLSLLLEASPRQVDLYSQRGDALLFLGRFKEAAADYDQMVELDAALDASHWRRGIALFYAGEFDKAARQFERYHSFDNVDRENGIWRYLCQYKADGAEAARAGLLKYEKDDREPFGDVYRLFEGAAAPETLIRRIEQAEISLSEREKRLFYAHLYIGLWHAVRERPEQARPHLLKAKENTWGPSAGYGPQYMWHVGRLHYDRLSAEGLKSRSCAD
jgi:lipoprotein NlpI